MKQNNKKGLWSDQRGSILPLFGILLGAIVAVTGLAIDYGRAQTVQSKLHAALDAAGLAAGATAKSRDVEKEVLKFVEANFPQGYMETTYDVTQISVRENPTDSSVTIDLRAEGEMKTSFMNVFSFRDVDVAASTEVIQARRRGFELVMVLDNSGSMATEHSGISRRNSMVNAANQMLDMLYGTSNFYANMFVGLVPFNHAVNVGPAARTDGARWSRPDDTTNIGVDDDVLCDYGNVNIEASNTSNYGANGRIARDVSLVSSDAPPADGQFPSTLFRKDRTNTNCKAEQITAMQNTKSDVKTALAKMKAEGNTRIDQGAIWGWRMLSPRWRGEWAHEGPSLPLDYHSEDMDKVVILLTDGENCCNTGENPNTVNQADQRLKDTCASMKKEGIYVYTIGFCLTDAKTQGLLRQCATTPDHYSWACGNSSIEEVFKKIADSLMNLRISK